MWGWIALLLVVWLIVIVFGALIKGLFYLVVIGAILFAVTAIYGWAKGKLGGGDRKSISS